MTVVGRGRTPATVVRFLRMAVAPFLVLLVFLAASRFADVEGLSLAEGAKPDTSGRSEPAFSEIRFLMDTVVRIQVWGDKTASGRAGTAAYRAMQEVAAFADRFNPDSEVSRINQAAGKRAVPVSAGLFDLLDRTLQVSRLSEGALDPTIGPLVDLWGFSRENPRVPAPEDVAAARHLVRYQELILDRTRRTAYLCRPGMVLDLGATAKGYAVDAAGKVLRGYLRAGAISAALIDAGGDILVIGSRPGGGRWRIGVRNPRGSGAVGIINLAAGAAVTSGDYERFFVENGVRYSHLLDPHTGYPATRFSGVTVVAPDSTMGDALSTAVFVLGPWKGSALLRQMQLGGVLISPDLATATVGDLDYVPARHLRSGRGDCRKSKNPPGLGETRRAEPAPAGTS